MVDWKTAKYTKGQDELLPIYEVQLIGYGILVGTKKTLLDLVYMEPQTGKEIIPSHVFASQGQNAKGFSMDFHATVVPIVNDRSVVRKALTIAREIYEMEIAPEMVGGCKHCLNLDGVMELLDMGLIE